MKLIQVLQLIESINAVEDKKRPLNVITLFSGMGAPEIALDNLGIPYKIILAAEYDDTAGKIYKTLHSDKFENKDSFIKDVYDILPNKKKSEYGKVKDIDLLVGGFPCQAFSGAGKGFGFHSTKVYKPENEGVTTIVHGAKHLKSLKKQNKKLIGTNDELFVITSLPDTDNVSFKVGDIVKKSTDSDGKLSLETINVINSFKPKVAILENVSKFADAVVDDDIMVEQTGHYNTINNSSMMVKNTSNAKFPKRGTFLRLLGSKLNNIGYDYYPMFLDPTTYANASIRRPRVYIVCIRKDVNKIVNKGKDNLNDEVAAQFGIETYKNLPKKQLEKYIKNNLGGPDGIEAAKQSRFKNTVDLLLSDKYDQYLSSDNNKFAADILARCGHKKLVTAINIILNKNPKLDNLSLINSLINKMASKKTNPEGMPAYYASKIPIVLNSSGTDLLPILTEKLNEGLSNINWKTIFGYEENEEEYVDEPVQAADNANHIVNDINLYNKKIKLAFLILQKFLAYICASKNRDSLATAMKGHRVSAEKSGSAYYYIISNSPTNIKWGLIHPAALMRLMGMYNKRSENPEEDNIYNMMRGFDKNKTSVSIDNDIMARIGNSMSVDVLEKLLQSLYNLNIF